MAYNVAANLRQTRPGAAFLQGRDNAVQNELVQRRQLQDEQSQQFAQENTLFQQDRARAQDQRQAQMDQAAAAEQEQAQSADEKKQLFTYFSHLSRLKANPAQFNATAQKMLQSELFRKHDIQAEDLTPDQIDEVLPMFAAEAGQAPAAEPDQFEEVKGPRGAVMKRNKRTGELSQVVGPDNSQPSTAAPNRVRTMTPQEMQAAGLPQGTSAQIDSNGKIDILNKREGLSAAEQKTVREAKMRMPRLNAAMRRVERLGSAVAALSDNPMFNGGPMDAKVLQYRPEGREVMAASAQLMPELTALTRVPGIGSQSDLEARLASLAMPSLEMPPEVNARSQAELVAFVKDLQAAYESLLQGGQEQPQQPAQPAPAAPTQGPSVSNW
jgi:hypothetical protein